VTAAAALAALVVGALIGGRWLRGPGSAPPPQQLTHLSVDLPAGQHLSGGFWLEEDTFAQQRPSRHSFALSPDGRHLVYVASDGDGSRLHHRPMGEAEATPMPGTAGASSPFFSPDGTDVAFFVGSDFTGVELKRVSIETGAVRTLATSGPRFEAWRGGHWTDRDAILLASADGIYEVPANGGRLKVVTTGDSGEDDVAFVAFPELLPSGQAVLYNAITGIVPSECDVVVESLDTGQRHVVVEGGSDPRYVPTGHVLFARSGALMAVPFDVARLEVTGSPIVVLEDVMQAERAGNGALITGAAQFSVSRSGTLAYAPGGVNPVPPTSLVWVDREGASEALPLPQGSYAFPRFSPDGTRLAYAEGAFGDQQIWVYDIELKTPVRLTTAGTNSSPVWSPDGTRLAFSSQTAALEEQLLVVAADGSGEPQRLAGGDASGQPASWSADGRLAFLRDGDIWTISTEGDGTPEAFLETPFREMWPAFSPDGRWLAYASRETGSFEVYVRPFPEGAPVHRVSTGGGGAPLWSRDGRQLFYRMSYEDWEPGVMVVDVATNGAFTRSQPRKLLESGEFGATIPTTSYDVAPDGRRFVMFKPSPVAPQPVTRIRIVLNWLEELKRLAPAD